MRQYCPCRLQQSLPFTVLKRRHIRLLLRLGLLVATVLTVYGIETHVLVDTEYLSCPSAVATVLTVYGIETFNSAEPLNTYPVATVLTVYGIETLHSYPSCRW